MSQVETAKPEKANTSLLIRGALWIAIGALIAAAIVCVVWVLIGDQNGLIGRAFLTILLLAAFAGIAILEAGLAPNRPDWLALASMITWIIALLVGAVKIWLPEEDEYSFSAPARVFQLLLVVGILQLALLHVRLFTPAAQRHVTTFTRVIYWATIASLIALVGMVVFFLTFPDNIEYSELYWRIVVALTILAAVGTTLIPLLNALFAPKKAKDPLPAGPLQAVPQYAAPQAALAGAVPPAPQQWPTYADGFTPLPVLPDGSPDWNAYYTGFPTYPQAEHPGQAAAFPVVEPPQPPAPVQADPYPSVPPVPSAPEPAPQAPPAPPAPGAYPPAPPAPPQ